MLSELLMPQSGKMVGKCSTRTLREENHVCMGLDSELACSHYCFQGRTSFSGVHKTHIAQQVSQAPEIPRAPSRENRSKQKQGSENWDTRTHGMTENWAKHQKTKDAFSSRAKLWEEKGTGEQVKLCEDVTRLGVSQSRNWVWYFLVLFHS